ncbi:MAG: hypothetical protein LBK82_00710 [Planctomycetaceae bacterium]|jgi:hypothetical protein|nr:hypothetical protein [Planctomycetaceae bacterium]
MKRLLTFASFLLIVTASTLFAQDVPDPKDVGDLDRDAAVKAFAQLTENVKKTLSAPDAVVKNDDGTTKFNVIAPVSVPLSSGTGVVGGCTNAVKVWFELSDGRYVNPKYYRWAPNEVFYVHVLSAVPVYVTLYQNYPGVSQSKRAYPDGRFPASFRPLKPGEDTRLPVAFQMDGNHNTEFMSIVVTKADWEGIRTEVPQAAAVATVVAQSTTNTTSNTTSTVNTTVAATNPVGVFKGAEISNESILTKFSAMNDAGLADKEYNDGVVKCPRLRYYISYPRYIRPVYYCRYVNRVYHYVNVTNVTNVNFVNYRACYTNIDDAALYLFSDNGVGQLQLSLHKCGPHWHW